MTQPAATLTQMELLALALEATRTGDNGRSLAYLKEAAARDDATEQVCFLLGSEYAQLRLMDDAVAHMRRAIEIDPAFAIARFQLGMLYLTGGAAQEAVAVWEPLAVLPADDFLCQFHQAMLHLIADEADEALACIERGVRLNSVNPALIDDMRMVAAEILRLTDRPRAESPAAAEPAEAVEEHLFLSAYQRNKPH